MLFYFGFTDSIIQFFFFSVIKVVTVTRISLNLPWDEKELVTVDYIFDRNHCDKGDPTRMEICALERWRQRAGLLELPPPSFTA